MTVALIAAIWSGGFTFLAAANYLPHRFCYLASPGLVWTNAIMDALIGVSYALIFGCLFFLAHKLRHLPAMRQYLWIFIAFGSFIVACGATHFMEIVTIWWPVYRLSAAVKVVCAAASVPTAILFYRVTPALTESVHAFILDLSTTQQEKEQAISSLISAEKLAVAGRISASIAHEIKNPLDAVGNLLFLIRTSAGMPAGALPYLDLAESELRRADHIAGNTLSLYRESSAPVRITLATLVEGVVDLQAMTLAKHDIQLHSRIDAPLPLWAYPGELRQILINLIQNSISAIGEHGEVFVRVRLRRSYQSSGQGSGGAAGYAITIADTGPGIQPADRRHLFTLFFTTKGEEGTGLGLWLVQSLVAKQGGYIRFRSRVASESPASGTVFQIWLPLRGPAPSASESGSYRVASQT